MPRKTKKSRVPSAVRRLDKLIASKEVEVKKTRAVLRTLKALRRLTVTLSL